MVVLWKPFFPNSPSAALRILALVCSLLFARFPGAFFVGRREGDCFFVRRLVGVAMILSLVDEHIGAREFAPGVLFGDGVEHTDLESVSQEGADQADGL